MINHRVLVYIQNVKHPRFRLGEMELEFRVFLKYRLKQDKAAFNQMQEGIFLWKPWHFSD